MSVATNIRSLFLHPRPTYPIAEAAADLFCQADPGRVRRCAHPACVLYFLDGTKNGTRRWCDMRTCGNRTNAAAYYRRRRAESPGA